MDQVYDLWFKREYENRENTELRIGIYKTEADAKSAIRELTNKPGFKDWPQGFEIYSVRLNQGSWSEGFKTVYGPPPKDAQSEAFDVPFWLETNSAAH